MDSRKRERRFEFRAPQKRSTDDHGIIIPFPVHESTHPYYAGLNIIKPRDRCPEYYPRPRPQNSKAREIHEADEISVSWFKIPDRRLLNDIHVIPTSAHPRRIFLPDLPNRPIINNEPPGFLDIYQGGAVVLYKRPAPMAPPMPEVPVIRLPSPPALPASEDIPATFIASINIGANYIDDPAAAYQAYKECLDYGYIPSANLLRCLNAKLDKLTCPSGAAYKLDLQAYLLSIQLKAVKEESRQFEEEKARLLDVIKEQDDRIGEFVERIIKEREEWEKMGLFRRKGVVKGKDQIRAVVPALESVEEEEEIEDLDDSWVTVSEGDLL